MIKYLVLIFSFVLLCYSCKRQECKSLTGSFYDDTTKVLIIHNNISFEIKHPNIFGKGKFSCYSNDGFYTGDLLLDNDCRIDFSHNNADSIFIETFYCNEQTIKLNLRLGLKK
jgi:hypothetical protein